MQGWVSARTAGPSTLQLSSLTGAMQRATSTPSHLYAGTPSTPACLSPDLLTRRSRWEPLLQHCMSARESTLKTYWHEHCVHTGLGYKFTGASLHLPTARQSVCSGHVAGCSSALPHSSGQCRATGTPVLPMPFAVQLAHAMQADSTSASAAGLGASKRLAQQAITWVQVKLCDLASGAFTHSLVGHRDAIWALHWSLTSEWHLFTSAADGQVCSKIRGYNNLQAHQRSNAV